MLIRATESTTVSKLEAYFNFWPTKNFVDDQIGESDFSIFVLGELNLVEIGAHTWVGEEMR